MTVENFNILGYVAKTVMLLFKINNKKIIYSHLYEAAALTGTYIDYEMTVTSCHMFLLGFFSRLLDLMLP